MSNAAFPYRAFLGLGGNIDDPVMSMARALRMFDARPDSAVTAVSHVYRTPPWGKTDQAWFHNACAQVETSLEPLDLIATCLEVERSLKRVRAERWGPRIIDIDILVMQDAAGQAMTFSTPELELPHPRIQERAFVLVPLHDIAPALVIAGHSVGEWLDKISTTDIKKARTDAGWWRETGV